MVLSEGRRRVVKKAWDTMDRNQNGYLEFDELKAVFNVKRFPAVLRGEITEAEVASQFYSTFDQSGDGKVSLDEFFNYYENVSNEIESDLEFERAVFLTWRVGQPNALFRCTEEDMRQDALANFRTTNSMPINPQLVDESALDDNKKQPRILTTHIKSVIDPFPIPKVGQVKKGYQGEYGVTTQTNHKMKSLYNGDALGVLSETLNRTFGSDGKPMHSLLNRTTTSTHDALNAGLISDEAMQVYLEGRRKELELEQIRADIRNQPPVTTDPECYQTTSAMAHTYLLPAVDRTARTTSYRPENVKAPYHQTSNHTTRKAASPVALLKAQLVETPKPAPYLPKSSPWVGGGPATTYRDKIETTAQLAVNQTPESTPEEIDYLQTMQRRKEERVKETHGDWANASALSDPGSIPRDHDRTRLMKNLGAPLQKNVSGPLNVWDGTRQPNMYATSNQMMQSAFSRDVLMKK